MGILAYLRKRLSLRILLSMVLFIISTACAFSAVYIIYSYLTGSTSGSLPVVNVAVLSTIAITCILVILGYDEVAIASLLSISRTYTDDSSQFDSNNGESTDHDPLSESELLDRLLSGSSDTYELVISMVEHDSVRTADLLRDLRSHTTSTGSFDELANTLELGIRAQINSPIKDTIRIVNDLIRTKKYVDAYADSEMRVVEFDKDTFYVNSEGRRDSLRQGMRFELSISRLSHSGEAIPRPIGLAEVEHASSGATELRVIQWRDSTSDEEITELREDDLRNKRPVVDIPAAETLRSVDMDALVRIRDDLRILDDRR